MSMKLQGTLSERDFYNAALANLNQIIKIRLIYAIILLSGIFILMDVSYMGVTNLTYIQLVFLVFFITIRFIILPIAVRKIYKESVIGKIVNSNILIDDEGIISSTEYRNSEIKWKAFRTFAFNKKLIFLYPYGGTPIFISRSLVSSDDQWNKLIDLITKHLPLK